MIIPLHSTLSPLGQRRAFSPAQVAGLRLWLRADLISGLSDGAAVATWPDDSGNARDAAQATAANQPTYRTNVVNGRPVVRFDGTDDWMSTPSLTFGAFTAFYVYRATAGLLAEHSASAVLNDGDYFHPPGGAHAHVRRGGGGGALQSSYDVSPNLADNAWRLVTRRFDGSHAGHALYTNGTLQGKSTVYNSADPGTAAVSVALHLGARGGASLFFAGDLAELLVYDAALSTADREAVQAFLAAKYGLSLP
jgi:hypothetical protein